MPDFFFGGGAILYNKVSIFLSTMKSKKIPTCLSGINYLKSVRDNRGLNVYNVYNGATRLFFTVTKICHLPHVQSQNIYSPNIFTLNKFTHISF